MGRSHVQKSPTERNVLMSVVQRKNNPIQLRMCRIYIYNIYVALFIKRRK